MQQSRLDNSSDFQMDLYWILTGFWYHILFYIQILPHTILESHECSRMSGEWTPIRIRAAPTNARMRMVSLSPIRPMRVE